jgi:hypothetical protein
MLLIAVGQPWLGAATLGVVLGASVLRLRMLVRAAHEHDQAFLAYAQTAGSLGGDPAPVIKALQQPMPQVEADDEPPEPLSRAEPERRGWSPWLLPPRGD